MLLKCCHLSATIISNAARTIGTVYIFRLCNLGPQKISWDGWQHFSLNLKEHLHGNQKLGKFLTFLLWATSCASSKWLIQNTINIALTKTIDSLRISYAKSDISSLDHCFLTFFGFVHPCHRLLHSHSPYCECMSHMTIIT